jgi:hypothetical protein
MNTPLADDGLWPVHEVGSCVRILDECRESADPEDVLSRHFGAIVRYLTQIRCEWFAVHIHLGVVVSPESSLNSKTMMMNDNDIIPNNIYTIFVKRI